jgi:hypothetical protein
LPIKEWITSNLLLICWSQLFCHRFKIQFIIIALKSVYGIKQLVNGLSYALDVLGILLSVNRWVKKSIQEKNIFIALVILFTKILLMIKKNLCLITSYSCYRLNVFIFLLRKNTQALIINVAIYKSGLESGFY